MFLHRMRPHALRSASKNHCPKFYLAEMQSLALLWVGRKHLYQMRAKCAANAPVATSAGWTLR